MGELNQMNRFILCAPLRPLSKINEWKWDQRKEQTFQMIKEEMQNIIEYFKKKQPMRIVCNARREGLGVVLQQQTEEGWMAIHFASRFLTAIEQKYSKIELELLALLWAIEMFGNFVYGTQFEVVSDHKAVTAILKGNRANKTYFSRLTPWVDQLLPFQFTVKHEPGGTIRMADYLSRHPSPSNKNNQTKTQTL